MCWEGLFRRNEIGALDSVVLKRHSGPGARLIINSGSSTEDTEVVIQCRHRSFRNELEKPGNAPLITSLTALLDSV